MREEKRMNECKSEQRESRREKGRERIVGVRKRKKQEIERGEGRKREGECAV